MRYSVARALRTGGMIAMYALAFQMAPALSQQSYYTPNLGGLVESGPLGGGATLTPQPATGAAPNFRPLGNAVGEVNFSLQGETWSGQGNRVESGTRVSELNNYTRGLPQDFEVAVTVPFEWLNYFGGSTGFGDTEIAVRKYLYDPNSTSGTTVVASGKIYLPTGDINRGTGIGRFSGGASVMAARPFGSRTQGYAGVGYNIVGQPSGFSVNNVLYYWAGGVTGLSPRWATQYEINHFNSAVANEGYTRLTVGLRRQLTPTRGVQVSIKQELQADGHSTTLGLGYSARV